MSRQNETKTFEEKLQELQELRELRELRETLSRIRESNSDQTRDQEQRQNPALLEMIDKCVNNIEEVEQLNKLDPADHPRMIRALKDWVQARPHNVKICISSRGKKAFQEAFESYPGYNIDGVNLAFPRMTKLVSPDEPYKLEYNMVKRADGSMLYLLKLVRGLIREESRSCGSIEEIVDALTKCMLRYRGSYDSDMLCPPRDKD
ncbi:uncharacterized protein BO95DRAFT_461852 [Aspergillus brunneoviolaceus CBS 621.78]|uniref:Uncharacterized protein n=1 Tax=Aspergillus brunneoviolaceus CBS 621.78 TaxID=1450534 RepID=A0ACD1GEV2_9EURO|nr:hypothetical protein BO95DRAFT_461852 [Aspergillus brunneoviolaceus CBS 621.78]RAH47786.1 hypothetical protein BO95DRAFT_461852 [Aspergillus brunneoviolaceus CBS 621.78]